MVKPDVLIIGGGPAGLAAAIAARLKGLSVAVVEAAAPPIDKACGEGLMPDGVEALKALGVRLGPCDSAPFRGITFINGQTAARAEFPGAYGLGVRRTVLHRLMAARAAEVGVELRWSTCIRELDLTQARWIVGADGGQSRVREWAGFGKCAPRARRFGFRRHFRIAPWSDTVDVHWGRDCQIYITPVNACELCVAVISRNPHLRLDEALRGFPAIEERLRGVMLSMSERGSVTESRRLRRVWRGNVALIGDASGSVDAIAGEGLALSFRQALALAGALAAGDLEEYGAAHRRIVRTPAFMARLMLLLDGHESLRRRAIEGLSRSGIFSSLIGVHIGAVTPLEFCWRLLAT